MGYQSIDITITDNTPSKLPIQGVIVRVFSEDGKTSLTQVTTNSLGVASFLLADSTTYQLRFYKPQVTFSQPQLINVLPAYNAFSVTGTTFSPPVIADPRLCMAYGFFRTLTGGPASNVEVIFISRFDPLWLEGASVLTERQSFRTDAKGYLQVPLIRFGQYDVTVTGYEDYTRTVYVPDAANVNVNDLLFPIVSQVIFGISGPYTLNVGQELLIAPVVQISDGRQIVGPDVVDVKWSSSDTSIFVPLPNNVNMAIKGLAPGTAYLQAERWDKSIIHIPDPGIQGLPIQVTVLP